MPEIYDRNLAENTVKAIKKIDKVRVDREAMHHEKRMKGNITKTKIEAAKELSQSIVLVKPPAAVQQDPSHTLPEKVKVSQEQIDKDLVMEE